MRTKKIILDHYRSICIVCHSLFKPKALEAFLKKAKKVLTPSNEPAKTRGSPSEACSQQCRRRAYRNWRNPHQSFKDKVDVQLVGAYGKSTSENYGEVSLVLKVKMIANKNEISIGGNSNWPVMLIDEEGNVSEPRYLGWTPYSVSEGIYMKIILKDSSTFTNVKKSAKIIQKAQIALSLSYDEKGLLIMKNVPIQWDVQP